jgi:hypothetical protein
MQRERPGGRRCAVPANWRAASYSGRSLRTHDRCRLRGRRCGYRDGSPFASPVTDRCSRVHRTGQWWCAERPCAGAVGQRAFCGAEHGSRVGAVASGGLWRLVLGVVGGSTYFFCFEGVLVYTSEPKHWRPGSPAKPRRESPKMRSMLHNMA